MLRLKNFPNCCTATTLVGFGQTETADFDIRPTGNVIELDALKKELGSILNRMNNAGHAVVTCITNNEQTNAEQALTECGFQSSDWMSKRNHSETKVKLWWFPLNELDING